MLVLASRARRRRSAFVKAATLTALALVLFTPKMDINGLAAPGSVLALAGSP